MLNCSYNALRISVPLVAKALEGKWGSQGTVEQRRGTHPWVGQACGEGESVGSGHKWFLGENPSFVTVCLPVNLA